MYIYIYTHIYRKDIKAHQSGQLESFTAKASRAQGEQSLRQGHGFPCLGGLRV